METREQKPAIPRGAPGNERIAALSDGVFSIAITLLVLELAVPEHLPDGGMWAYFSQLLPKFASTMVAFIVLGVYWIGHHNMFKHIKRHDRVLMWLNILFLMFVAMMPFFAGLVGEYGDDTLALASYAFWLMLTGLVLDTIWWHASKNKHLVDPDIDPDLVFFVHRRVLIAPVLYLVSIGVAFFSPLITKLIFVAIIVIYVVPSSLDQIHHKQLSVQEDVD
ncbi:MAG: hypothetical protein A2032_00795 [Chloroflexi bacterium RBG_19FT_COMBO_49_13]|nr:MAG: hypothetical protein A2Y53_07665 [Chloroflexi bacterium RBG_16_47_49]OGO61815.1 MAG: hypothetical protein A2032_00795 [Chloroflexi bacterium RBG_19FT_COMBO_49_13]